LPRLGAEQIAGAIDQHAQRQPVDHRREIGAALAISMQEKPPAADAAAMAADAFRIHVA